MEEGVTGVARNIKTCTIVNNFNYNIYKVRGLAPFLSTKKNIDFNKKVILIFGIVKYCLYICTVIR